MRNQSLFFGVLLLLEGVFGVENYEVTVSVMEGDSVTLNTGDSKIPEDDTIQWWFGVRLLAHMNKAANISSTSEGDDAGFRDRLKLNHTGSLTITNTGTNDSGLYKLLIKGPTDTTKIFKVTVRDDVESLSVIVGDPVTLYTNFNKIQRDYQIKWKFGDQVIPTVHLNSDANWKNINLDIETGDLTIRNIRRDQSGDYEVEIINIDNSLILHRKFRITSEMKFMLVKDGDSVTLQFATEIQRGDLILWMFGPESTRIAEINKAANTHLLYEDVLGGIFRDRLKLDYQTGSLTITNTRPEHTGLYNVELTSSSRGSTYTRFIVTLRQDLTYQKTLIGVIVVLVLVLVAAITAGIVIYWKYRKARQN